MPLYLKDKLVSGTGTPGKSAYQTAVEAGYTGTETAFNEALSDVPGHIDNMDNPHGVTAAQVNAYTKGETDTLLQEKADSMVLQSHITNTENPHRVTAAQTGAVASTEKGSASGVATLGADSLLTAAQRPKAGGLYRDDGTTTVEASLAEISTTLQNKVAYVGPFVDNGNFNDYTTPGSYVIGGSSIKNGPTAQGYYYLDTHVFSTETLQIAKSIWTGLIHFRRHTVDIGWTNWNSFATATDLDTKVSKSGDTMTGDLWLVANENGAVRVTGWDDPSGEKSISIEASKTGGSKGRLIFNSGSNDMNLIFQKCQGNTFYNTWNVLHTGNKPSGSYTGNGSATERKIDTGGIGDICLVWGYTYASIVTPYGTLSRYYNNETPVNLKMSQMSFEKGVLTIATDNAVCNYNTATYYYQVL